MKSIRFEMLKLSNSLIAHTLQRGGDLTDCIIALADQNASMFKRILELESIAPKKIKTPDGRVMIWHCPDNLVPLDEIKP